MGKYESYKFIIIDWSKMEEEIIRVRHPDFGHVEFTNPTARQKDVLNFCKDFLESACETKKKIFNELEKKKNNSSQS